MQSQNRLVLKHLQHAPLTSWQAFKRYHITRISARIYDLRRMGHDIKSPMVRRGGRRFSEYRLAQ